MKLNRIFGLIACTIAFSACQDDTLESGLRQNKIYSLSGKMTAGKTMSRAQIQLGNTDSNVEYAYWNEGDAFTLYQTKDYQLCSSVFSISSDYSEAGDDKQAATFSTSSPADPDLSYRAIYPADTRLDGHSIKMDLQHELDFSAASTEAERAAVWSDYLQNNMYMMANGTLSAEGENEVNFRHLCALMRVTYTNETGEKQSIEKVGFAGQDFVTSISYNVAYDYQDGSGATNYYEINTNGLTVEAGASTDMYFFCFPFQLNLESQMYLKIVTNSEEYRGVSLAATEIQEANGGSIYIEAGKRYWFKVTEYEDGLVWSKDFNMEPVTFDNKELSFALYNYLGENMVTLTEDSLAVMEYIDVLSVTDLQLGWNDWKITSLAGIENFVNITNLSCGSADLESCDLSQNKRLRYLDLCWNKLSSLDLSNNPELLIVNCSYCDSLKNLDITGCTQLTDLSVEHTALETLEVPNPGYMSILYIGNTKLYSFDLSEFVNLVHLDVDNMNLDNLDLIPDGIKTKLTSLFCDNNNLQVLDLQQYPNVTDLHCVGNKLTELDITSHQNISGLSCGNQQDGKNLTLKLTSNQKETWDSNWGKDQQNNINIILEVVE